MTKTIYRSVTAKRRTSRPKSKRSAAPYAGMLARLQLASAALGAARGRR